MNPLLPIKDNHLQEIFGNILSEEILTDTIVDITTAIYKGTLNESEFQTILDKYKTDVNLQKEELLYLLLCYIYQVLRDNHISTTEANYVEIFKKLFKIKEGDFYKHFKRKIEDIINIQVELMYINNQVDIRESIQKVKLQKLFDLGYDQFLELSQPAFDKALSQGADPLELDHFFKPY